MAFLKERRAGTVTTILKRVLSFLIEDFSQVSKSPSGDSLKGIALGIFLIEDKNLSPRILQKGARGKNHNPLT